MSKVKVKIKIAPIEWIPGSHGPQTWWVGVTLSETRRFYVGLVAWVKGQGQIQNCSD